MGPITLNSVNHDGLVKTTLRDGSILPPTPEATVTGIGYLQPFFSRKGRGNTITRFTGIGAFDSEFGSDVDDVRKYGHGGLIAREVLAGGGIVDACRLMPSDALRASSVLKLQITEEEVETTDAVGAVTVKDGATIKLLQTAYSFADGTNYATNMAPTVDVTGKVHTFPLFAFICDGAGEYGNKYYYKIVPSSDRDGKNGDGRRYDVIIYEKLPSGSYERVGSPFETITTALNPNAVVLPGSTVPDSFDVNYPEYKEKYNLPVSINFDVENYEAALEVLRGIDDVDTEVPVIEMLDILTCKTVKGLEYASVKLDTAGIVMSTTMTALSGGTDGDLFSKALVYIDADGEVIANTNGVSALAGKVYYTAADMATLQTGNTPATSFFRTISKITTRGELTRKELLISFYSGEIDQNLFDCRVIESGITLDAWWPLEVKNVMATTFGEQVRDDIYVVCDLGPDIYTANDAEANKDLISVSSTSHGQVTIVAHNGKTINRVKNVRTSCTYELASSLPKLYRNRGNFTVLSGYFSGKIQNMKLDYYPRVVKDNLEIAPLKDAKLLYALRLDSSDDRYWMNDESMYNTDYSVMNSFRNGIFIGVIIRLFKRILAKYSFHPGNAAGAIPAATLEISTTLSSGYYPSSIPVKFTIFQTKNDKINKTASCDVAIYFPDVIEAFNVTITANRQESK